MTNYEIGRRLEYRVINILKENLPNCQIVRTAGSHSPVDVLVLELRGRKFVGIQCKSRKAKGALKGH